MQKKIKYVMSYYVEQNAGIMKLEGEMNKAGREKELKLNMTGQNVWN